PRIASLRRHGEYFFGTRSSRRELPTLCMTPGHPGARVEVRDIGQAEVLPAQVAFQRRHVGAQIVHGPWEVAKPGIRYAQPEIRLHLNGEVAASGGAVQSPLAGLSRAEMVALLPVVLAHVRRGQAQPTRVAQGRGDRFGLA